MTMYIVICHLLSTQQYENQRCVTYLKDIGNGDII